MKNRLSPIAAALAIAAAFSFSASVHARPIADSTGVQALTGVKKPAITADQIDPNLISNQGTAYDPSWTSYFIGQKQCDAAYGCATIRSDGSIYFESKAYFMSNIQYPTPLGLSGAAYTWPCGYGLGDLVLAANPTGYSALTGSRPTGWSVRGYVTSNSGACSP